MAHLVANSGCSHIVYVLFTPLFLSVCKGFSCVSGWRTVEAVLINVGPKPPTGGVNLASGHFCFKIKCLQTEDVKLATKDFIFIGCGAPFI